MPSAQAILPYDGETGLPFVAPDGQLPCSLLSLPALFGPANPNDISFDIDFSDSLLYVCQAP